LLLPVAFLPLLGLKRLLIAMPVLGASVLAGQFFYGTHHVAAIIPFIFLATISALASRSLKGKKQAGLLLLFFALFTNQLYGGSPFSVRFYLPRDYHYWKSEHNFKYTEHDALLDQFVELVPQKASVSASNHIGAHLSRRKYINFFPYPKDLFQIDYILVDLKERVNIPWLKWNEQLEKVQGLKEARDYALAKEEGGIYLFRKRIIKEN
jgi:uncharacterized membrane protein